MNEKRKPEIIPAVLEESIERVEEKLDMVKGLATRVGVDVVDGVYADNLTIGVEELAQIDLEGFLVDVQLIVEYPIDYVDECGRVGVTRVFGHVERMGSQIDFVERAIEVGVKPGLALDLHTPVSAIEKEVWAKLDGVLLMSVKAGFSGQTFNPGIVAKIKQVKHLGFTGDVQMDGGMNPETIERCYQVGANQFAITHYLWGSKDVQATLESLQKSIQL